MIENVPPSPELNEFPELMDVSALPLEELMKDDRSALQNSLRRVREAAKNRTEKYAAFTNAP